MAADWVRLDADYFTNPKVIRAGREGRDLHLASMCWTAAHLTDGHVPEDVAPLLIAQALVSRRAIDLALRAGLWFPNGDGWEINDYLMRNPSKADVERERAQWRERARRHRQGGTA